MSVTFYGIWSLQVVGKNADAQQQIIISGSDNANGVVPGIVGGSIPEIIGVSWKLDLQWRISETGEWKSSSVRRIPSISNTDGLMITLAADDNDPSLRDGDFDDLTVRLVCLDPVINPRYSGEPLYFILPKDKFTGSKSPNKKEERVYSYELGEGHDC